MKAQSNSMNIHKRTTASRTKDRMLHSEAATSDER